MLQKADWFWPDPERGCALRTQTWLRNMRIRPNTKKRARAWRNSDKTHALQMIEPWLLVVGGGGLTTPPPQRAHLPRKRRRGRKKTLGGFTAPGFTRPGPVEACRLRSSSYWTPVARISTPPPVDAAEQN